MNPPITEPQATRRTIIEPNFPRMPAAQFAELVESLAERLAARLEASIRSVRPTTPEDDPEDDAEGKPPMLDRQQLADALGVSLKTIDRYREKGRIPQLRAGRAIRFDLAAVRVALSKKPPDRGGA